VRERISTGKTSTWTDGPLTNLNLLAMQDPNVGMQVCWYGSQELGTQTGMHLWYAPDAYTLSEYAWTDSTSQWTHQSTFTANGHAGIGCYSWGSGTVNYAMIVGLDNNINIQWKDMSNSVQRTSSHPVGVWTNSSVSIPGVFSKTSLGYTDYFFAQMANGSLAGFNISFNAENTRLVDQFTIPQKALAGSHFSVNAPSSGHGVIVFDQVNGSDIVQNIRDSSSAQWSYVMLSIPDQ
jgi:hypothetical protein